MKFISSKLNLIIWDKERDKMLCRFQNGQLETSDERVIQIIKNDFAFEIGYEDDIKDHDPEDEKADVKKKSSAKKKGRR